MTSSLVTCEWLKEQLDKGNPDIKVLDGKCPVETCSSAYSKAAATLLEHVAVFRYVGATVGLGLGALVHDPLIVGGPVD